MDAVPDLDLVGIQARCDAATPGPWMSASHNRRKDGIALVGRAAERGTGRAIAVLSGIEMELRHHDAVFIAAAREDVPALLAEVHRLRAALGA